MARTVFVRAYRNETDLEGWDPNKISGCDYGTSRALQLYEVLGASLEDEEYVLAAHDDGRWALFGLSVEGYEYAVEDLD